MNILLSLLNYILFVLMCVLTQPVTSVKDFFFKYMSMHNLRW